MNQMLKKLGQENTANGRLSDRPVLDNPELVEVTRGGFVGSRRSSGVDLITC